MGVIDVYINTTTNMPEEATEFDLELFERFMSGGPWVAYSEYMKLMTENAKLRELVKDFWRCFPKSNCEWDMDANLCTGYDKCHGECGFWVRMRELGIEVD